MATKATVSTKNFMKEPEAPVKKKKSAKKEDLSKCGCCSKKLEAFVAADGLRFCSDNCVTEYLA